MKILSVASSVNPDFGGPPEAIKNIAWEAVAQGHEYHVATTDAPGQPFLDRFPKVFALGPGSMTFSYSSKLGAWLAENMKNYDAVIVHGLWQYPGLAVWAFAKKSGARYWVIPHGMLDPYFNKSSFMKKLRKNAFWVLQHRVLENAVSLLFTSEEEMRLARSSFRPYRVQEKVISYAAARPPTQAAEEIESFLTRFPVLRKKKYLLFFGRIHPKKGPDMLLRAFASSPDSQANLMLVMAGPVQEEYQAKLEQMAADSGISESIVWTGMLSGAEKYGAIKGADAFVLPSHQENFGIAVAEALACGVPTLISKPVNIWREIDAYKAGLVEDDTGAGTLALLERWAHLTPEAKEAMRLQALKCYEDRFTVEACVADLLAALGEK